MLETSFYREELFQMRKNYKNNPLNDIKLNRPKWLDLEDPMCELYFKKSMLLQQGEIIYANIVQANTILFKTFPQSNCPANIVYSTDPYFTENPEALYDISEKIYSYKDQKPETVPNEWKEVARVITDEFDRSDFTFSFKLQDKTVECRMIPTMIYRKLLPKRKLCGSLLPILISPESKQVLILPKRYWTKNFTEMWVNGLI